MQAIIFMIMGIITGTLSGLIPGLNSNLILLLSSTILLPITDPLYVAIYTITAVGVSLYTHRLSFTFHPIASTNLASMDPAQRLMANGQGRLALELMTKATDQALKLTAAITIITVIICSIARVSPYESMRPGLKFIGVLVILIWMTYTCYRTGITKVNKLDRVSFIPMGICFFGFTLTGIFGYSVLHFQPFRGSDHSMLIILSSLIGIPMVASILFDKHSKLPKQAQLKHTPKTRSDLAFTGFIIGSSTGFLAGLGSSSLVSMAQQLTNSDEEYVYMSTTAEAANTVIAILLVMTIGIGRSGDAVLLGRLLPDISGATLLLTICLIIGIVTGKYATKFLRDDYIAIIEKIPLKLIAVFILTITLGSLLMVGHPLYTVVFTLIGIGISTFCRVTKLPNQVVFGSMAFPVLAYYTGLVPVINNILGL